MNSLRWMTLAAAMTVLVAAGSAKAETKVEVKGVHLCCGACVKAVAGVLKKAGATGTCDKDSGTVTITATDDAGAQKAISALAAAGFHGETGDKNLAMKNDSGAKGKAKSVTITGAHNCCGACCKAIKGALSKVEGVTGDTAKPKSGTFTVTGDFDIVAVVKALNASGFHVKVKADKE